MSVQAGERHWVVPEQPVAASTAIIEPDLSNAAPFLAAAAVTGGSVTIPGWPEQTTQVGAIFPGLLERMGARVDAGGGALTVAGTGVLHGIDVDMGDAGELVPTLAATCALADSPSRIRGVGHLRGHETDRLAALVEDVNAVGGDASERPDGLEIRPGARHGGVWRAHADHRMATAGALIGLRTPGVVVDDIQATSKTLPQFARLWSGMLGEGSPRR